MGGKNEMKKSLSILLAVVMLCACLPAAALAAGGGEIAITSATAAPGDTVTLTVSLKSNPGVAYLDIPITYDTGKLEAPTITGQGLTGWSINKSAVWYSADNSTYTGDILTLTFKIKAGASGTASVSVGELSAFNAAEAEVSFRTTPGIITIKSNTPTPPTPTPTPTPTPMPEARSVSIASDGKTAKVTGDYSGLYARVALVINNSGQTGLYVTQTAINANGTIVIPQFQVPGLTVKGVNVALVPTLADISSAQPTVVASDFKML